MESLINLNHNDFNLYIFMSFDYLIDYLLFLIYVNIQYFVMIICLKFSNYFLKIIILDLNLENFIHFLKKNINSIKINLNIYIKF